MLTDAVRYLETRSIPKSTSTLGVGSGIERGSYEVLIVDDGSRDNTTQVALRLARELNEEWNNNGRKMRGEIKVITLVKNRGKGGSVKHVGRSLLFTALWKLMSRTRRRRECYILLENESSSSMRMERLISPIWSCCKRRWIV